MPQHAGQQEAGRHGLAFLDTAIGIGQSGLHEGLLGTLDHHIQQRVDAARQAQAAQLLHRSQRMAGLQQLEHFIEQAALRHIGQQRLALHQGLGRLGLELEALARQLGGEAHGADDAHRIFTVARGRVANHAQHALLGVVNALVIVDHDLRARVVVHGVDREVAARGILVLRTPDVVAQHAAAGVHRMVHAGELGLAGALVAAHGLGRAVVQEGAEGGDFDDLVLAPAAIDHVHDAKALADDEGAAEQALDLLGRGIGGHVEVLGAQAQQQVAHGAADDVGLVARILQRLDHVDGTPVHQVGVDAVHLHGHLLALAEGRLARPWSGRGLAQQLVDDVLDHGASPNRSRMRQPRSWARARSRVSGLVATGWSTRSSRGTSFQESL